MFLSKTLNIQRSVVVLREDVGHSLTTTLPRVNFLGVIAGILALVSIPLPWWGITATGFGSSTSSMGVSLVVPATTPISTTLQASPIRSQLTAQSFSP